jgi:putative salt-induced outer membrane protein YdiY
VAPRAAIIYRYMLTDGITFGEDFEVLLNVIEVKRYWINSATKILVRLSNVFSVSTALTFKYDSEPADGAKKLDTTLSLGLDAMF